MKNDSQHMIPETIKEKIGKNIETLCITIPDKPSAQQILDAYKQGFSDGSIYVLDYITGRMFEEME